MERRLGRGLGSLLGAETPAAPHESPTVLEIARIRPNPFQPRKVFEPAALEELTNSIRSHGVLQPIVVRPVQDGYELVAGERRWRASQAASRTTIPAVVRADLTDQQMLELALVENVQRQDLDAIERAQAFRALMVQLELTQDQVSDRVGLKRSTVANHLRLLDLPEDAQRAVQANLISMGHARALLGLSRPEAILALVERVVREGLSVRETEDAVRKAGKQGTGKEVAPASPSAASVPPWVRDLEGRMREHLGTRVHVRNQPGFRGEIVIEYFQRSDLDRLVQILAPKQKV